MSTRATIHFESRRTQEYDRETGTSRTLDEPVIETEAIVYRHGDGYPEGLGADIVRFIGEVRTLRDTRLGDPAYLAAKWVVFDVLEGQAGQREFNEEQRAKGREPYFGEGRLEFLGCGIVMEDPGDIEYRYHVLCDGKVGSIAYDGGYGEKWDEHGVLSTLEGVTA